MNDIVHSFVSLRVSYGYTEDEIQEELDNLMGRIEEAVEQYYQELNAEMAYERIREEGSQGSPYTR
jgi:glutamate dehydrogenase/leucine dehydrogenase